MDSRVLQAIAKLKKNQDSLEKTLTSRIQELETNVPDRVIEEVQNTVKNYSILNGYWHLDDENLGIRAEGLNGLPGKDGRDGIDGKDGRDGKDGLPGKDGAPGKDGKDGLPGKDGKDGKDGTDGVDGKDAETPEFEVGDIKSVSTYDPAKVELIKKGNKYIINMEIPRGRPGSNGSSGSSGAPGKDATINGENTLNILAGKNVNIEQKGNNLIINAAGGGAGGTSDYLFLENKPQINGVELEGNKTHEELGIDIPDVTGFVTKDTEELENYYDKTYVDNTVGNIEILLETI